MMAQSTSSGAVSVASRLLLLTVAASSLLGLFVGPVLAESGLPSAADADTLNYHSVRTRRDSGTPDPVVPQSAATTTSVPVVLSTASDRPLLGVNGTGQLRLTANGTGQPSASTSSVRPTLVSDPISTGNGTVTDINDEQQIFDTFDLPTNESEAEAIAKANNYTILQRDFTFYNSSMVVDVAANDATYHQMRDMFVHELLSQSHRRAITVELSFVFPFYGHLVRNISVATGGFIYTGEYVHSWLAATQYIAPLMANFDTSLNAQSKVRYRDNGTAFSVLWENLSLQDHNINGTFSFGATLHSTGHIAFNYFSLPIGIDKIHEEHHPVKIGLSDAYILERQIVLSRRKTIYEYHRVKYEGNDITNGTIIRIAPNPTCHSLSDCATCTNPINSPLKCTWCPAAKRCSTGFDRKRQDWLNNGCDRVNISKADSCEAAAASVAASLATPTKPAVGGRSSPTAERTAPGEQTYRVPQRNQSLTAATTTSTAAANHGERGSMEPDEEVPGLVTFVSVFMPIGLVLALALWLFYAYRYPHTKSGQLLIQYRPAQWSWRRSEARYTAATIHM